MLSLPMACFQSKKDGNDQETISQVPLLTQDITWESNKTTLNITSKSQEVSPFPAGDNKAAMNRRESMRDTRHKNTYAPQKKYRLGRSVKIFTGGLKPVSQRQSHPWFECVCLFV